MIQMGVKVELVPDWTARKLGVDMALINSKEEREKKQTDAAASALKLAQGAQQAGMMPGGAAPPQSGMPGMAPAMGAPQ